jgi:glyoxylase I family protein
MPRQNVGVDAAEALRSINAELGECERKQDVARLAELLHDELEFRRADGTIVTKQEYLDAVPARTYTTLESEVVAVDAAGASPTVTVIVRAAGTASGTSFAGTFRNTRVFVEEDDRWQCRLWVNSRLTGDVQSLHHVTLPVTDLERSKRFYSEVLRLEEIDRPPFDFPGAWYAVGNDQVHLLVSDDGTFRDGKGLDSGDVHFGIRVPSFREAVAFLESQGYRTDAADGDLLKLRVTERPTAGFPQIYILDPDRHVIEINAEHLD